MSNLENFRFKVFRTVAGQLSLRKAAEHLFLTQPAVTLQIRALEEELGVRLFDRAGGRVSLTHHGRMLLPHAEKMAAVALEAEAQAAAGKGELAGGDLALGVSTTIAQYVLPRTALAVGTTTKLARALWIVPLSVATAIVTRRKARVQWPGSSCSSSSRPSSTRPCPSGTARSGC